MKKWCHDVPASGSCVALWGGPSYRCRLEVFSNDIADVLMCSNDIADVLK